MDDLQQTFTEAANRIEQLRKELAMLPYDLEKWHQLSANGQIGELITLTQELKSAEDRARLIANALAWIATTEKAKEANS